MYIQEIHKVEASVTHKIREFDICLGGVRVENFFLQRETYSKENATKKHILVDL